MKKTALLLLTFFLFISDASDICAKSKKNSSESKYDDIILFHSHRNRVDPFLVKALIKVESNFYHKSVSCKGAKGLMQLMPGVLKMQGVRNAFDPHENIGAGTRHLSILIAVYNGDLDYAIAAYNAGLGAVNRYDGIPPYKETANYVKLVKKYYKQYKRNNFIQRKKIYSFEDSTGYMYFFNE
ncbi:MAG: hypothetical protein A2252_03515 [Elusimicrobia bacterium RIFOXYA2_FULL_39_19]|nr:MAG: hypothetical protein A2252_03515 [Elusimicrobia bacterium RIFOXYA2_FULL_39_19]